MVMLTKLDAHGANQGVLAAGMDLPLDQAILAAVQDRNGTAAIVETLQFGDLRIDETCQTVIAGTDAYPFKFDVSVFPIP